MKLSNDTKEVLKNYSTINANLLVSPGNKIATMSQMKNIVSTATVSDTFDTDFAILEKRAEQVRENTDFQSLVSQAMADKINNWNNEYDHIEQMIYAGGFPSKQDKDLMADFHRIDSAEELSLIHI